MRLLTTFSEWSRLSPGPMTRWMTQQNNQYCHFAVTSWSKLPSRHIFFSRKVKFGIQFFHDLFNDLLRLLVIFGDDIFNMKLDFCCCFGIAAIAVGFGRIFKLDFVK
jgi:hypothetical protein